MQHLSQAVLCTGGAWYQVQPASDQNITGNTENLKIMESIGEEGRNPQISYNLPAILVSEAEVLLSNSPTIKCNKLMQCLFCQ